MARLENKTAIITGAGTGIGRAIARAFVREGAKIALVGRRSEPLDALARELGTAALVCAADVCKQSDIDRILQQVEANIGTPNVLVNNAGVCISVRPSRSPKSSGIRPST